MHAQESFLHSYRHARKEENVEQPLPSTPSYPAQHTQLKCGIRTLAASQAETMQAFTALHHAAM
jgi:hypothetical protein